MDIKQEYRLLKKDMLENPLQWFIMLAASGAFGAIFTFILIGLDRHPVLAVATGVVAGGAFLCQCSGKGG